MSKNNEAFNLLLAVIVTSGFIFGGLWLLMERWAQLINTGQDQSENRNQNNSINFANQHLGCNVENLPKGRFNYGGSTTWAPIRKDADSVLQNLCPQFILRYTQPASGKPGSSTGIRMLIDNQLAFSQSSRSIKAEENVQAQQKGFSLKEIPVAIDGIAIAVNFNLNIPGLTVTQLKNIYTGNITNWREVGGPNLPITPISRNPEAGGTVEFFIENVLEGASFGSNVTYISTTTEALQKLATTSSGIYYASAPEVVPQCTIKPLPVGRISGQLVAPYREPYIPPSRCPAQRNQLNFQAFRSGDYPITRNLFVILKQNAQTDQQAGEAYASWLLTSQGQ